MIVRNISYKGIDLGDSAGDTNHLVIQEMRKDVKLRTTIYDKQTYHGSNSSFTLAGGRVLRLRWQIFWTDASDRMIWQTLLNGLIIPEAIPTDTNRGFYELTYEDDNWAKLKCLAKVYEMPIYSNNLWSPIIDFSFKLYVEESYVLWYTDEVWTGSQWLYWGIKLWTTLGKAMNDNFNAISCDNNWNFMSPCKIEVVGTVVNPKILNTLTWWYYKLWTTTTNLVIDNTWKTPVVADDWVNVSWYRTDWSTTQYIYPWVNDMLLLWDNLTRNNYSWDTVTVTISYNDSFINS